MKIRSNDFINKALNVMNKTNENLNKAGYDFQIRKSQFNRLMRSNLSNTDVLKNLRMTKKSPTTSQYKMEMFKKEQRKLTKRVEKEIEHYSNLPAYRYGKELKGGLLRNNPELKANLEYQLERAKKEFEDVRNIDDEIRILKKMNELPDYEDYQKSGLELLEYARDESNANKEQANVVIEAIRRLTPEDYNRLYYQERILNKLIHAYNNFKTLSDNEKELRKYEIEIATNFENMFESLGQILKNDYSYALQDED